MYASEDYWIFKFRKLSKKLWNKHPTCAVNFYLGCSAKRESRITLVPLHVSGLGYLARDRLPSLGGIKKQTIVQTASDHDLRTKLLAEFAW